MVRPDFMFVSFWTHPCIYLQSLSQNSWHNGTFPMFPSKKKIVASIDREYLIHSFYILQRFLENQQIRHTWPQKFTLGFLPETSQKPTTGALKRRPRRLPGQPGPSPLGLWTHQSCAERAKPRESRDAVAGDLGQVLVGWNDLWGAHVPWKPGENDGGKRQICWKKSWKHMATMGV